MPQSSDVDSFYYLIASLDIADTEHLIHLCKIYLPGKLQIELHSPSYFANIIEQVNKLNPSELKLLKVFLEGVEMGIHKQNSRQSVISQNTFIVGGQSTINNHVISQTNSTNLAFNFEPSLFAQAIEKGLINESEMKELLDIIGKNLEHRSSPTNENQSAEKN